MGLLRGSHTFPDKEIDMSKWTLALCIAALLVTQASAKVPRGRAHKVKIFAADHDSVLRENEAADAMGALRYFTQAQVDAAVQDGTLVPLYNHTQYVVSRKLPINRRYALPATVSFVEAFSMEFYRQFHQPLMVDSAVRAATTQHWLHLGNAAPAYGPRASSHERATTVDISKHLTKAQQRWLMTRLLYYRALGRVLVIQERGCFHIFVKGDQQ